MKKILIIETANISKNTSIAHVRNSVILSEHLKNFFVCELVDLNSDLDLNYQWDIILFSYAGMGCNFSQVEKLVSNQKNVQIGWITNEFELFANGFVKEHMEFMINNFDKAAIKKAHTHKKLLTTNLNTLIAKKRNPIVDKKYKIIYYGTYRKYRQEYFLKYFKNEMILSTSKKNWKSFLDCGVDNCLATEKVSWENGRETLNLFEASLYIEDTKTHKHFNYMANRFFEGLYCNCPLYFDVSCKNTINKDVYEIDDYFIVESYEELIEKINNPDKQKIENYLETNTKIALQEKAKSLREIRNFLKEI